MKILRQILRFFIVGVVLVFLLIGSKLLYNKQNNKFTELIKPNEAKADTPTGGVSGGDNGGACEGSSCGSEGSSGP